MTSSSGAGLGVPPTDAASKERHDQAQLKVAWLQGQEVAEN